MVRDEVTGVTGRDTMGFSFAMGDSLDRWITGNYGEDEWQESDLEDDFDPRYDEPLDFGEEDD